jgi:hypothetical protein
MIWVEIEDIDGKLKSWKKEQKPFLIDDQHERKANLENKAFSQIIPGDVVELMENGNMKARVLDVQAHSVKVENENGEIFLVRKIGVKKVAKISSAWEIRDVDGKESIVRIFDDFTHLSKEDQELLKKKGKKYDVREVIEAIIKRCELENSSPSGHVISAELSKYFHKMDNEFKQSFPDYEKNKNLYYKAAYSVVEKSLYKVASQDDLVSGLGFVVEKTANEIKLAYPNDEHAEFDTAQSSKRQEVLNRLEQIEDKLNVQETSEDEKKEEEKSKTFEDLVLVELNEIMKALGKEGKLEILAKTNKFILIWDKEAKKLMNVTRGELSKGAPLPPKPTELAPEGTVWTYDSASRSWVLVTKV